MLSKKEEIHKLIPQKPPMVMVDILLEHNDLYSISSFTITDDNIFCNKGDFAETGLIENMAQTAALRSGHESSTKNTEPQIGFIGSLKRMKIYYLPKVGETIKTKISIITNLMNVQIIKAEVFREGILLAEGEMNIFLQEKN